ncbi:MAG: sigma-54-dependent Fis family transcriptional regulator [Rhodothermaceae bacterium]|nr:sigma-54-dependent Fis family transcriptional regulator [Rhodothermaceae bacterium]
MSPTAKQDRQPHVLVVDDEHLLHGVLERLLTRHHMRVTSCHSAPEALDVLAKEEIDLVITDFQMPGMNGFELLAHVRESYPRIGVIMITGHANIQHAVQAMAHGAVDYLPKPFSTSALLERVQDQIARLDTPEPEPHAASSSAPRRRATSSVQTSFVGEHPSIESLRALIKRVAQSLAPVFVHGESGTGKEVVSRLVHQESDRAAGPFVAINCANLPRELVESHLFGHQKGAFTGAVDDAIGAFEQAEGGTLLLDEVTEVEPSVQAKLLRVLQEQEYRRVGDPKPRKTNVRVIATSNRDLKAAVAEGVFREDLYHRIAVFPVTLPPLRARRSDIPLLAERFTEKYSTLYGLPPKTLAPDLLQRFQAHDWPGNVRELENMIHRGVVMAAEADTISADDVMNSFFSGAPAVSAPVGVSFTATNGETLTIEEMERHMILEALAASGNNQREAAEKLGICARTIRNKLKKYREDGHTELSLSL